MLEGVDGNQAGDPFRALRWLSRGPFIVGTFILTYGTTVLGTSAIYSWD